MSRAEYEKARRKKLKAEGRCIRCGKENDTPQFLKCTCCREIEHEKNRLKRQESKAKGLCTTCNKKIAVKGKTLCQDCLDRKNQLARERWHSLQEIHICPMCGVNELFGTEKTCPECRAKAESRRVRKVDKSRSAMDSRNAYNRNVRDIRRENGVCTCCGKRKPNSGYKMCPVCLEKASKRHKRKINIYELRDAKGTCHFCDNPRKDGYKVCEEHYQNLCDMSHSGKAKKWRSENRISFRKAVKR